MAERNARYVILGNSVALSKAGFALIDCAYNNVVEACAQTSMHGVPVHPKRGRAMWVILSTRRSNRCLMLEKLVCHAIWLVPVPRPAVMDVLSAAR